MKTPLTNVDVKIEHNYEIEDNHDLCSGIVISAALTYYDILSIFDGVVLQVNKGIDDKWTVIVQYDSANLCKYNNLVHVSVKTNQAIKRGSKIGTAHSKMKFEYLTNASTTSKFNPIRFGRLTFFITDPSNIFTGKEVLGKDMPKYEYVDYRNMVAPLPNSDLSSEFKSNNSGGVT